MAAQLLFGAGNSVTFGSVNAGGVGASQSFSKSALSNLAVGDLLVAWLGGQDQAAGMTVTPPSGWVHYGAAMGSPSWATSRDSNFWYYPIPDAAALSAIPATLTWTFSSTGGRGGFVVARATGVDLTSPEDSAATAFNGASNSTTFAINGITTVNANTLLVGGLYRHNSAATTVPTCTSFMTAFQEYNSTPTSTPTIASTSAVMGYTTLTTAGATGTVTATFDQTGTAFGGELVAFKALTGAQPITRPTVITASLVTATGGIDTATSFTIGKPAGLQDGDLMIVTVSTQTATSTADFACSGWQRISAAYVPTSAAYRITAIYAKPIPTAASESASSYTFTSTDPTGGRIAATAFIVRGADLTSITAGVPSMSSGVNATTISTLLGTPTANGSLLLTTYNGQFTTGNSYAVTTAPAGMTAVTSTYYTSGNGTTTPDVVYAMDVEAVSQGTKTLTWAGTAAQASSASVYIRKLGAADVAGQRKTYYTSSTGVASQAAGVYYTSAVDTLASAKEMRPFPNGYGTVTAMLAANPFYVAHRGGSRDWPEMSLYAYTQSGYWGAGALEVSVARTSDGVYFGLHDADINRTSGTTGLGAASTMTWAQIQGYQILGSMAANNPAQPNRPYMKLDDLLRIYSSHVILIDSKYVSGTYYSELIALMNTAPNNPTQRLMGKSYGVGASWSNACHAAGYQTWGYYYDTDYTPTNNIATNYTSYDILGLDYNASQAAWTYILGLGKPVMAHILPDANAFTTAQTKAAASGNASALKGYMVSGVQAVVPRHL